MGKEAYYVSREICSGRRYRVRKRERFDVEEMLRALQGGPKLWWHNGGGNPVNTVNDYENYCRILVSKTFSLMPLYIINVNTIQLASKR